MITAVPTQRPSLRAALKDAGVTAAFILSCWWNEWRTWHSLRRLTEADEPFDEWRSGLFLAALFAGIVAAAISAADGWEALGNGLGQVLGQMLELLVGR